MKPILFQFGSFRVPGYGFMIGIGFLIAMLVGVFRAKKKNMSDDAVIDIAVIAIFSGFLGAKVLYVLVSFKEFIADPMSVLGTSGFVVYGGIIAGTLCAYLYCRFKKLSFMEYFDLIMPEVSIAQAFGRLGCFMAGCCYGRHTDGSFAVVFPEGSMAPAGVGLIPTQLISAAGDMLIAIILIVVADVVFVRARSVRSGYVASLYMVLYGIGRFAVEFLRDDYRGEVGMLSTSQFISLFIVAGGIALYVVRRNIKDNAVGTEQLMDSDED